MVTTVVPIDMTEADPSRKKLGDRNNTHVSIGSLIVKATANALEDFPYLCGFWDGDDRVRCASPGEITIWAPVRVGNALGFLTIERASQKTLLEISRELDLRVDELRSRKKIWEAPSQPCFLISNVGTLGPVELSDASGFVPLTVASMATSAILEKPAVRDGDIQIRKMMNSILFWNHRAMNADIPIEFQTRLKRNLEEPSIYLI